MSTLAAVLVGLVALSHVWFLVLEMVLWRRPIGLKLLRMTQEQADISYPLAMNQGLYNGFLAAGLVWSLLPGAPDPLALKSFFLGCVVVAGVFGAITASRTILFIQALPGAVALGTVWAAR